jgi:hypothetical protein
MTLHSFLSITQSFDSSVRRRRDLKRPQPLRSLRRRLALLAASAAPALAAAPPLLAATTIGQAGDGAPDFFYDAATGDFRFFYDGFTPLTIGGDISIVNSLSIQSASGKLIVANVNPTFASGVGPELLPNWLASSIPTPPGFTDGFDIGNVLPTGLSAATLTGDLTIKYQTLNGGSLKSATLVFTAPTPSPSTPSTAPASCGAILATGPSPARPLPATGSSSPPPIAAPTRSPSTLTRRTSPSSAPIPPSRRARWTSRWARPALFPCNRA